MITRFTVILLSILPLVPESAALSDEVDPALGNGARPIWGNPVGGLSSHIYAKKSGFVVGEPIIVYYEIKNVSKQPLIVWHSGFWSNHLIWVVRTDGKEVELTKKGKTVRDAFSPGGIREKNVPFLIEPGKVDSTWSPYDITQYFQINAPGTYVIQYIYEEYQERWNGRLLSNEISVNVEL